MIGLGLGLEGAAQGLDPEPGDIEGAQDGDDAEDLGEGGDQGAEAQRRGGNQVVLAPIAFGEEPAR